MLREEFENLLGPTVVKPNAVSYHKIEYVYNWHPCNFSKEAIAYLYSEFGMCIIYDLMARSQLAEEHQERVVSAKKAIDDVKARYDNLCNTNLKSMEVLREWLN